MKNAFQATRAEIALNMPAPYKPSLCNTILWTNMKIESQHLVIKLFRTVSNVIGAVLAVMAVYELVKIYLQFRVYGAIKKEENEIE